jgi:hypothetical protein
MNNGVMQPVSRPRIGKQVPAARNMHTTIELLLEKAFSTRCVRRGYKEDNLDYKSACEDKTRRMV